jgi:hypothetical protein
LDELKYLFTSVQQNRSLSRVICADHAVDSDFLRFIGPVLMANRRITFIRLDSNNFFDYNVFTEVFQLWQGRGIALAYPWREADLDVIPSRDPTLTHDLKRLRVLHDRILNGNAAIQVPPESIERPSLLNFSPHPSVADFGDIRVDQSAGAPPFPVQEPPSSESTEPQPLFQLHSPAPS